MDTLVQLSGRRLSSDHPRPDIVQFLKSAENGTAVEPGEPLIAFSRVVAITPQSPTLLTLGTRNKRPEAVHCHIAACNAPIVLLS